jgi:cyclopropane fatty-acyl-phospholipid synthase-like methyltransferase
MSAAERMPNDPGARDMSPVLDALSMKFVLYARTIRLETLDIGCGAGAATAAALERGGYVVALDPDSTLLEQLRARIPVAQQSRLRTIQGRVPSVDFDRERFAAVHAAHVLQHLSEDDLQRSLRKVHGWLKTHGMFFVSVTGQTSRRWESVLRRSGFEIDDISTYPLPGDESQLCIAIVARRPADSSSANLRG